MGGGKGDGMMGGDGDEIDFDAVGKVATRSDEIGNEIVKLSRITEDESAVVAENHPSWALAGAIGDAQRTNESDVQGFGRWSCDMGDRLNAAMRAYKEHDDDVSDELNGIGN